MEGPRIAVSRGFIGLLGRRRGIFGGSFVFLSKYLLMPPRGSSFSLFGEKDPI
jgi:hypothetical protein